MRRTLTLLTLLVLVVLTVAGCRAGEGPRASLLPTSASGPDASRTTTTANPGRTTTTVRSTTTTTRATTTTRRAFTERARVTTWYTDAAADNSAWVHFKAVDEEGRTVAEVPGSDLMNLENEADEAARTPARERLVDALRQAMQDDGWAETGVAGEWYEYTFGR